MNAKSFSSLAAFIFIVVSGAQGYRAFKAIPVQIGSFDVPVAASWIACAVLAVLALIGLRAASR